MPRTEKSTTAKSKGAWPNGLRFLASLFFLYALFGGLSAGVGWWSVYVSGAGSLWLPILFGIAVLSSIGLFFSSLAGLVFKSSMGMGGKMATVASFALIALTYGPSVTGIASLSSVFWVVILGFILAWVGTGIEMM